MMPRVERQSVASELEDARQEAVARQEAGQTREVGERGVRGEHQQHCRRDLDEVVERRARADEGARQLADDGLPARSGRARCRAGRRGSSCPGRSVPKKMPMSAMHDAGVARLRRLERRNAVGDGFCSGQRDRAGRECTQDQQPAKWLRRPPGRASRPALCSRASCPSRSGKTPNASSPKIATR